MTVQVDVAVVGAGPAGMEAAFTVAEAGANVTLIDCYPRPGGQYFKQIPGSFLSDDHTPHHVKAETAFHGLEQTNVQLLKDTVVWGAPPISEGEGWLISLYGPDAPRQLQAKALVLAPGAYDRPIAFPGWTLPGVMTAGAVQTMIKSQRVLPGRRFLLSGTGPLQLAVADQLVRAGAEVVGLLEGASLTPRMAGQAQAAWGQWERMREGWGYWRTLRQAGVPIRTGWAVIEARGDGEVREAVIARLDDEWRPIPGSSQTLEVDAVVLGYGFIPSTELSRLLGCQHDLEPEMGGYVPRRDGQMQTTLPGVYSVGDGAGIGGAELARLEGRIAGVAVAGQLGMLSKWAVQEAISRQQPDLARERRFAHMLGALFTPGPGIYSLAKDDTIICRCEEVTKAEIFKAISEGCESVTLVKRVTRAGMGNCQGRVCGHLVAAMIAEQTGQDLANMPPDTVRPPVRPIPLDILEEREESK